MYILTQWMEAARIHVSGCFIDIICVLEIIGEFLAQNCNFKSYWLNENVLLIILLVEKCFI